MTGVRSAASSRWVLGKRLLGDVLLGVLLTGALSAPLSAALPLTAEQEATARRVEEQLMAPCCFGSTVATHHSPAADEIRAHVRDRVAQGATAQEILDEYLDRYGERILAQPLARGFNLLAYWLPVVGLLCGTVVVVLWLRRRRRGAGAECLPPSLGELPDDTRRRQQHRLEEELAAFDEGW
jgi:cytochrome c-type biogenesis protein CcmH